MPNLYDSDFVLWSEKTAKALRDRSFNDLDWDNLIEEIEQLGRNNKHALSSQLRRLLHHLLKWEYQPDKRTPSWSISISNSRFEIQELLQDSPSLKAYFADILQVSYQKAIILAANETGIGRKAFPDTCPYQIEQILDVDFLPDGEL